MKTRSLLILLALLGFVFAAPSASAAPNRAYELVSPPDKNGGDVLVGSQRVRIADDGSAVEFYSQSLFGDVIGAGLATEYIAQREPASAGSTQGWSTRGIIPPQPSLTPAAISIGLETRYLREMSSDLSKGILFAWKPLTDAPAVANVANLYLRDNLLSPGEGNYQLLSDCPACISPIGEERIEELPEPAATTPDFSHVLFTSKLNLTANAKGTEEKLYEWAEGTLRLASILPDGKAAPNASAVGPRSISNDGSRVFFTAQGNAYMRTDGIETIKLNESERPLPDTAQGVGQAIPSADGTRVFLTTQEALTDGAPDDSLTKLYYYDAASPSSDPHNLTYVNYAHRGIVGASAAGDTVYFVNACCEPLVFGQPPPQLAGQLYAWHDGELSYIAEVPAQDEGEQSNARVSPSGNLAYLSTEPIGPDGYEHGKCGTVTKACRELYTYDITSEHLSCASCDYSATPKEKEDQGNTETKIAANLGAVAGVDHTNRVLTDDGKRAFFTTAAALVEEDTNGARDAYEYDLASEEVALISSGHEKSDSYFLETTPSGNDVIFATRQRLLGWDTDANFDLYDARVGGGFPEPKPAPAPCNGDSCYGPQPAPPVPAAGASATFQGAGDPPVKRKKRKSAHGKKKHHKRAASDRRHRR